jgi:6-phosphofructokinase 2
MKTWTLTLNPALDKSTSVDRMIPEQKLRCSTLQIDAGGGGINVSKGIHRLGGESCAVFPIGGHTGNQLKALVEQEGIATLTMTVQGATRENISVSETSTQFQYRFTLPGAEMTLEEAHACLELIRSNRPELLVASGSLPPGIPSNFYEEVAKLAKEFDTKLILDTSGPALAAAAQVGVYLLKPNLGELSALVGVEELAMNQVDDAAMSIIEQGKCQVVVVSLGPQGAFWADKNGFEHIPAPTVKKQTTVGAGDSMVAGMAWALSQGKTIREMVQMGVACGSAATMNSGTRLFQPDQAFQLYEWIQKYSQQYRFTDF